MSQTRQYEMKDSGVEWIGEIPKEWTVFRNKALFSEVNERCEASTNLPLLSVSEYYGVAPRAEKIAEDEILTRAESLEGYKICQQNDIVMNIMLAWKRAQGVSQYDGIVSPAYCVFRKNDGAPIDMRFIHYLIRTDRYADKYKCHSTGIIDSRLRLYPNEFLALESHVPPLPEQSAIAAYLDDKCATIDGVIAEAKATIDEYKAWKASVIFEAVTKGLNPDAEMKDSDVEWIGMMPKDWKMERAKFHFRQSFDHGNETPELLAATQKYGMYPQRLLEGVVQVMVGTDLQQFKTVHVDDFVISLRSFQGGFERSVFEGVCSPAYQVFHADEQYDVNWLKWFFKNEMFIDAMNALTVGIREGRNIKYDDFANSLLPVPPLPEQAAIAAYLDDKCATIDSIIAEKEALIAELEAYKKSLIFETVTGKRRVC